MPVFEKLYLLLFNAVTDALRLMQAGHAQEAAELLVRAQQACEELYRASAQRRYARKKASLAQREVSRRSRDGGIAVYLAVGQRRPLSRLRRTGGNPLVGFPPDPFPDLVKHKESSALCGARPGGAAPGPRPLFCKKAG